MGSGERRVGRVGFDGAFVSDGGLRSCFLDPGGFDALGDGVGEEVGEPARGADFFWGPEGSDLEEEISPEVVWVFFDDVFMLGASGNLFRPVGKARDNAFLAENERNWNHDVHIARIVLG